MRRTSRHRWGVLALALGVLASMTALLVVPATGALAAPGGVIMPAARIARADGRPTAPVAVDAPAVVRVLSYYYGTTKNGNLVPVPVACAGTGVLVGTTGINQYNYVLTASSLVNPITPCEGAQAAFQQVNQAAQSWGLIRVEVWLSAAYTGTSAKQLGTIKYQISPSAISTNGGPNSPTLIALPLMTLSGAPNHDLPVVEVPQPSDVAPATPNQTVLDLGQTGNQFLNRDSLADSEVLGTLYPATLDAGLLSPEFPPTTTKVPATTTPQSTAAAGTPVATQVPPTSTATGAPSPYAQAVNVGAPVVDDNGRLVGMVIASDTGTHVVAPLSQVTLAIGPVSGKSGPVMTQWSKALTAFYATPPDYTTSASALSGLASSAPDFGGVAPFLDAAKHNTTAVALPWTAATPTATPTSPGTTGSPVSLPIVLIVIGAVLFIVLLALVLILLRTLRRRGSGRDPNPPNRRREPTRPRSLDMDGPRRPDSPRGRASQPMDGYDSYDGYNGNAAQDSPFGADDVPTRKQAAVPVADLPTQKQPAASAPASRGSMLVARAAGRTDPGRKRAADPNQDNVLALTGTRPVEGRPQPFGLFIVADGMGGHMNGKEASRRAIEVVSSHLLPVLTSGQPLDAQAFGLLLQEGAVQANAALREQNQQQNGDMGTTMTAALVVGDVAYIANIGDSRTYLFSPEHGLRRITTDHSVVASLVAAGVIRPEDMYTHPRRNQIYRSLGGQHEDTAVDIFDAVLQPGDKLLLCSDGLWEMVRDPQIEQVLRSVADPAQAVDILVQEANKNGGEDNISVIVVRMLDERTAPPTPGIQVTVAPQDAPLPQ